LIFYDTYGFRIAVEGAANSIFLKEYGWARTVHAAEADLYVRPYSGRDSLPTKPAGSEKGLYIPFGENENTLWYENGVPLNVVLSYCEALMWWPKRTRLHAAAVARNGKAYVFTGAGNIGKTSTVLNLVSNGYAYLSDDWLIISQGKAYPFPKTIHIFDYNLKNKRIARSVLGLKRVYYLPYFKLLEFGRTTAPNRFLRFAFQELKPIFNVDLQKLNPQAKTAPPTRIAKIFYMERKAVKNIKKSNNITAEELASRMAYVNLYEWNFLLREYHRYAYIYGIKNKRIEDRFNHETAIMRGTFDSTEIKRLVIPEKLDLTKLDLVSTFGLD
jgi:hypothetical protein